MDNFELNHRTAKIIVSLLTLAFRNEHATHVDEYLQAV